MATKFWQNDVHSMDDNEGGGDARAVQLNILLIKMICL